MALTYDYDIHWAIPQEAQDDAAAAPDSRANYVAQFRNPETVAALRGADPAVQDYFTACGFGLDTYDSGAPEGCFPAEDLPARNDVTERLAENLSSHDLTGRETNGFDFAAFIEYEIAAQPIDMTAQPEAEAPAPGPGLGGLMRKAIGKISAASALRLGVSLFMIFVFPHFAASMLPI
ncbi:hypothetical protein [Sinisalibacter aestuarii]|uniref:Uncharacterized protein n=1 Tax=Sinisalibacter aestuarii TaxID=2949426 RepID=A0ABQ5LXK9_9RHOB|nr:hypothetical protein [Sinisalibacter aestuarii]GKY88822.1 hypothetical protein STA1M1_26910 [Sinisalibacter aestuarii]